VVAAAAAAVPAARGDLIPAPGPPLAAPADQERQARAIRDACREVVAEAWEEALASGLCDEGAFEAALGALSRVQPEELLRRAAALMRR
jgi:hypothetical protein